MDLMANIGNDIATTMIDYLDTAAMTARTIVMNMIDKEVPTRRSTANAHVIICLEGPENRRQCI